MVAFLKALLVASGYLTGVFVSQYYRNGYDLAILNAASTGLTCLGLLLCLGFAGRLK